MARGDRVRVVVEFTDDGPMGWHAGEEIVGAIDNTLRPVLGHLDLAVTVEA